MLDQHDAPGGERTVDCYCESPCCRGSYIEEHEGSDDLWAALNVMEGAGLIEDTDVHDYHCGCGWRCDYTRSSPVFTAQQDCTVGVEFVSRILSLDDWEVVATTGEAVDNIWRKTGRRPNGRAPWGNHIHVGARSPHRVSPWSAAFLAMESLDWELIACGGCASGRTRGYNTKPHKGSEPGWQGWAVGRDETVEYRLWNTPAEGWRIGFHVATSIALRRCASVLDRHFRIGTAGTFREAVDALDVNVEATLALIARAMPPVPEKDRYLTTIEAALC